MKNIAKTFPGVKALDNVNLKVEEGEIHALVGENGAGKSTLMNVLSGIYPYGSYEGDIVYNGEVCRFTKIKDSEEKGIVIIHQELALIPYMTIGENMYLGNEKGKAFSINWNETYGEADEYLKTVGIFPYFDQRYRSWKAAACRDRKSPCQTCKTSDPGRAHGIFE